MQKTIKKIGLLVLLILVLPISAFFIYQFASLNESEKELEKIYIQQLESVLYSVNQYSEDILSSWFNDIDIIQSQEKSNNEHNIKIFLDNNTSITSVFITNNLSTSTYSNLSPNKETELTESVRSILDDNTSLIEKLWNYLDKGYQKIEPIGKLTTDSLYLCLSPLKSKNDMKAICGIIFDPNKFISQNLVSKISQSAGDRFTLGIFNDQENRIVYSSGDISENEVINKKSLWLLPGLSLGIKMKIGSIEDLVSRRFYENIIILGFLLLILTLGLILIFYNIRKELGLAQLKSDFITNVSHELRTPLALISMYSETLVLDRIKVEKKKHEYYSVIHSETNRLSKIVNSILNFSKMENKSRKFDFQSCNLISISNEVFKSYDYHIKSKGFVYSLDYTENNENINADSDAISESIINLIENVLKYSGDKKEFKIIINSNNKGPYWEIKDYGIGISKEDQNKIFDKFYRVSSGLVHNTKGTGLGLSLVKQIMDVHNGEILVESKLGSGSTFRLQFRKNGK